MLSLLQAPRLLTAITAVIWRHPRCHYNTPGPPRATAGATATHMARHLSCNHSHSLVPYTRHPCCGSLLQDAPAWHHSCGYHHSEVPGASTPHPGTRCGVANTATTVGLATAAVATHHGSRLSIAWPGQHGLGVLHKLSTQNFMQLSTAL